MANGERRMANGEWRMANGEWKISGSCTGFQRKAEEEASTSTFGSSRLFFWPSGT